MKNSSLALSALMAFSATLWAETAHDSIADARARLARGENARVCVSGRVTFSNMRLGIAFVQDDTGGIAYDPRTSQKPFPIAGDVVEVSGVLTRRQGMVMILRDKELFGPPKVDRQESSLMRVRPVTFELESAAEMRIDGLLTQTTGVVRRVIVPKVDNVPMIAEVSTPSGYVLARLPWRVAQAEIDTWINSPVLINAVLVCQGQPPLLPRDADAMLFVPGKGAWTLQTPALEEVFQRPPATLSPELMVANRSTQDKRLHILGIVTSSRPRQWITLRTSTGSVQVMTRQADTFEPGDILSVACWPQNNGGRLVMLDGVCRKHSRATAPEPLEVVSSFMPALYHPMDLVKATGTIKVQQISGGAPRVMLRLPGGETCLVQWATFLTSKQSDELIDGSTMSVTGILSAPRDPALQEYGTIHAIQPRSVADVKLIKGPSWWTTSRLKGAMAWMSLLAFLGISTTLVSRWQVRRQRKLIRSIEARTIAEEERKRISRDFHDSLQQQLASAALHLETLKGAVEAAPDMMPSLIDDTAAMIRHCQIEARHCIWDLRSEGGGRENLAETLKEWLHMRASQPGKGGPDLYFEQRGEMPPLDEDTCFQILRIAQEAVNNALAHANARRVTVILEGAPERFSLLVEDDGKGFDATQSHRGRFGLNGQRERAHKIGAQLHFTSPPDKGTRMILCLPTQKTNHALIT
ncbi:histidine kinase [Brevifollis gellanilyticus]|nr:histidine kinase [Brevifollis gellanilyticus]